MTMKYAPLLLSSFLAVCGTLCWPSRTIVLAVPDNGTLVPSSEGTPVKKTTRIPPSLSVEDFPREQSPPGELVPKDPIFIPSENCTGQPELSIGNAYRYYNAYEYAEFKYSLAVVQSCIDTLIDIPEDSSYYPSSYSHSELISLDNKIDIFLGKVAKEKDKKICWPNDIVVPNVGKTCLEDPDKENELEDPDKENKLEDPDKENKLEDPDKENELEDPDKENKLEDPDKENKLEDPDKENKLEILPDGSTNNWNQGFIVLLMGLILGGGSLIVLLLRQSRSRSVQKTRLNQPDPSDVALLQEVTKDRTKN